MLRMMKGKCGCGGQLDEIGRCKNYAPSDEDLGPIATAGNCLSINNIDGFLGSDLKYFLRNEAMVGHRIRYGLPQQFGPYLSLYFSEVREKTKTNTSLE